MQRAKPVPVTADEASHIAGKWILDNGAGSDGCVENLFDVATDGLAFVSATTPSIAETTHAGTRRV